MNPAQLVACAMVLALVGCAHPPQNVPAVPVNSGASTRGVSGPCGNGPCLVPQLRHQGEPEAVAVTPSGKRLITTDEVGYVRVWDAETGLMLRTKRLASEGIKNIYLSGDRSTWITVDSKQRVYATWDAETFQERASFAVPDQTEVLAVGARPELAFAKQGVMRSRYLPGQTVVTSNLALVEMDMKTGSVVHKLELPAKCDPFSATPRSDGRTLLVAERCHEQKPTRSQVRLIDIDTGRSLRTMIFDTPDLLPFETSVHGFVLSPDEKRIAVVGPQQAAVRVVDIESGRELARSTAKDFVSSVAWAGSHLLCSFSNAAWLLDSRNGNLVGGRQSLGAKGVSTGKVLVWGEGTRALTTAGGTVQTWAIDDTGLVPLRQLGGPARRLQLTGAADENSITFYAPATDSEPQLLLRWDLTTGGLERPQAWPEGARVQPRRKIVVREKTVLGMNDGGILVADRSTGRTLLDLKTAPFFEEDWGSTLHWRVLPGEDRVAVNLGGDVAVHDLRTGEKRVIPPLMTIDDMQLVEDGKHAVMESDCHRPVPESSCDSYFFDFEAGTSRPLGLQGVFSIGASIAPDNTRLALVLTPEKDRFGKYEVTTYSLPGLERGSTFSLEKTGHFLSPKVRMLSGSTLATFGADDKIQVWDVSGRPLRTLDGAHSRLEALDPVPGDRILATSDDGSMRLFSVTTGHWIGLAASDDEWIAFSDDAWFDGSRGGGALLAAVRGDFVARVDQLAVTNNRPDLLLDRLGIGTPDARAHFRARYDRRLARLRLTEPKAAERLDQVPTSEIVSLEARGANAELVADLADPRGELAAYHVYVNGVALAGSSGTKVSGSKQRIRTTFPLLPGKNVVEVSALAKSGAESLRALRILVSNTAVKPRLFYLGFGVSRYRDKRLDLEFAHKDALDLERVFKRMSEFSEVSTRTYLDENATRDAVVKAKQFLAQSRPEDVVVVFVAGHGTHTRDAAADYFFVTHDTDVRNLRGTAASFESLESLFDGIPARRKLWFLDTCESGDVEDAPAARSPSVQSGLRSRSVRGLVLDEQSRAAPMRRAYVTDRNRFIYNDLARTSGATVFSSSRGGEASLEDRALQNGLFTSVIVRALTTLDADRDGNGRLSKKELATFVSAEVGRASNGQQNPIIDYDNRDSDIELPITPR